MPVNNISSLPQGLGNLPHIVFAAGLHRQLSQEVEDFKMVQAMRIGEPAGREHRFLLHVGGGPSAVQSAMVDSLAGVFPVAQRSTVEEKSTIFKEINTTINISETLARRLQMSGAAKYIDQLAMELEDKLLYSKRFVGRRLHMDGTGVLGTVSSIASVVVTGAAGSVTIAISTLVSARGHSNLFEFDELVLVKTQAGASVNPTVSGGTFYAYKVFDVRREEDEVELIPVDANQVRLSVTDAGALASGNVLYSAGQPAFPDLTVAIGDYNAVSSDFVGLESLIADDGRLVNGMKMEGILKSVIRNKSGQAFDIRFLTELVTALRNRNGKDAYKYDSVLMASETLSVLAESWRQDRRFNAAADGVLGAPAMTFQHGAMKLGFRDSEFARKDRAWVIPTASSKEKAPIQFLYSDFQPSKGPNGEGTWTADRNTDGARLKSWSQHMIAFAASLNKAPSACGAVVGFSSSI